jgi:hypothetical protein
MRKLGLLMVLAAVAAALGCNRPASEPAPAPPPEPAPAAAATTENGEPLESKAGTKHAWIYFTQNHDKGGESPYNTDCVASIVAERIGGRMGDMTVSPAVPGTRIIWHIRLGNGFNNDDKCAMLDTSKVYLQFHTDVFGKAAGRKLKAMGMKIEGTISSDKSDIGAIVDHKYQVMYDNGTVKHDPAGPDPIVVVGCSSCGDPPTN